MPPFVEIARSPRRRQELIHPVGIERGVVVFAALSDGQMIHPVNRGKKAMRALATAQRYSEMYQM